MKRSELRHRVEINTARTDKGEAVNAFLNDAIDALAEEVSFQELEDTIATTTEAGIKVYDKPVEAAKVHLIRVEKRLIAEVHPIELERLEPRQDVQVRGKPRAWALRQNQIWLWPVPESQYPMEIYISKWPTHMQQDEDIPPMAHADAAIISFATSELFWTMQQFEEAGYWKTKYNAHLKLLKDMVEDRPGWVPGGIKSLEGLASPDPQSDPFVRGWGR